MSRIPDLSSRLLLSALAAGALTAGTAEDPLPESSAVSGEASPRALGESVVGTPADPDPAQTARATETTLPDAATEVYEEVIVTGERAGSGFVPASLSSTPVDPAHAVVALSSLTDLVAAVPGVASHGQGGRLQLFSIRGLARHRVLSLISGVRLTGERRAGVSSSFVDPLLVGEVDVLRGPSSTHFGAGALGGAIRIEPRRFEGLWGWSGYGSHGGETAQAVGWGRDGWSVGAAHRRATAGSAADGTPLNDGFELYSMTLQRSWRAGNRSYELLVLPSRGLDIGKANTDFPHRATRYPEEDHLLLRLATASDRGGRLSGFVHTQRLITEVTQGAALDRVASSAVDFGVRWERPLFEQRRFRSWLGIDFLGRRGVEVSELSLGRGDERPSPVATLADGREDEAAAFTAFSWEWGKARLEAGGRLTWLLQQNRGEASRRRSAATAFFGVAVPLSQRLELTANAGTGVRFPTLSEQFYTGTTGRGRVVGNPTLSPERSRSLELGARWLGDRVFLTGSLFRTRIGGFIDRQEIAEDLMSFHNLVSGILLGVELEGFFRASERLRLSWGGHALRGRDDRGLPLADVPPLELALGGRFSTSRWRLASEVRWQAAKTDPGSGEKSTPEAWLLAASASYELSSGLHLRMSGSNLFDDAYFASADRKAPPARGRSFGLALVWGGP